MDGFPGTSLTPLIAMDLNPTLARHLAALRASGLPLPEGEAWDAFLEAVDGAFGDAGEPPSQELARYRSLVDHLREVLFQIDRDGCWSFLNPAWEAITGFRTEESLGQPFLGHMHPLDKGRYLNMLTYAMETGQDTVRGEFQFRKKEGPYFWVEMYTRITLDPQGLVIGVSGTMNDITERKLAQAALARLNSRLRALIENMQGAVLVETEDRSIALTNEPFCRMFDIPAPPTLLAGSEASELLEMALRCFLYPEDFLELQSSLLAERKVAGGLEIALADGRILSLDFVPIDAGEDLFGHMWLFHDITERKRAEAQLAQAALDMEMKNWELSQARDAAVQLAGLKSEFLANMSHEIRTPMNGIIGMTELLLNTTLGPEQMDYATTIRASAATLLRLINDILDFSKIEAGKLELETIGFDLQALLDDLLAILGFKAHGKGVELATWIQGPVPTRLMGDPTRLRQVLSNLTDNALKFTAEGSVTIRVFLEERTDAAVVLRFEIRDTGIGMAPEVASKLFQSFYQGDTSTTRKYGGTGLGLAICKRIVELMGGSIGVDTVRGEGSVFWFTARFTPQEGPQDTGLPPADFRFYLLDLPPETGRILEAQLREWGYKATALAPGEDAMGLLRERCRGRDDRSLLVFGTHGGLGGEVAEFLHGIRQDPALSGLRLIMAHSLYEQEEARKPTTLAIAEFLPLPMRKSHLKALLDRSRDAIPLPAVAEAVPLEEGMPESARILLAEDNTVNQKVALAILRKLGYSAELAGNGREALDKIRQADYDLVFMDCQMPEMDGFQAARAIREEEQGRRRVPILAMTANAMQGDRERCLEAGMDDYIAKPITIVDLKSALQRWLAPVRP